ncbi:MAG: M17 family peptidase N-terminal domain-containing protein, partial [Candidatus Gastranaerophilales bacterium]|nr:M17 family peptidase N-terminal domain-containing protein [Candidatus Gastranaerophilales bacterium]
MNLQLKQGSILEEKCDAIVISVFENVKTPAGVAALVDKALGGVITEYVLGKDDFKGKFGDTYVIPTYGKINANKVLLVGLGKSEELSLDKIRHLSSKIIKKSRSFLKAKKVCSILIGADGSFDAFDCAKTIAEGVLLGGYQFTKYKSKKDDIDEINEFVIIESDESIIDEAQKGLDLGKIIAENTNFARDLINEPPEVVTPQKLANVALSIEGVECKIIEKDEAEKLKMGAYLAVARGSINPPKFIHLTYKPSGTAKKKIALVGKGITFDSGGLSLKPASSMLNMKDDMSGAAAVLAVMKAAVQLKIEIEIHAIIAAAENMPDGKSYKPGDVLTAMNGKT